MKNINVGFIGLGNIGRILAKNISCAINDKLLAWERTKIYPLDNVIYINKLSELLSKIDILFMCVTDHTSVFKLIVRNISLFNKRKVTIIDHSTCYYKSSIKIHQILKSHSIEYIDMPFTRSIQRT